MVHQVAGILICKGEELYITSIAIKMNDCFSLSVFHASMDPLWPDLHLNRSARITYAHKCIQDNSHMHIPLTHSACKHA